MICGEKILIFQLFRKCNKRTQREDIENKGLSAMFTIKVAFEYYSAIERAFSLFYVVKYRASKTKHGKLNEVLINSIDLRVKFTT